MSASSRPSFPNARSGEHLPRTDRLRRRPDFLYVQGEGSRVRSAHFVIMVMPNRAMGDPSQEALAARPGAPARIGITVTHRVANAVGRNRVKRVVREVVRRNRALCPTDCVLVWVARSGADQLNYAAVQGELIKVSPALAAAAATHRRRPEPSVVRR
jgi:ribonuclease P protein component